MKTRFAVTALLVASLSSCGDDPRPVPEFKPGQMVGGTELHRRIESAREAGRL